MAITITIDNDTSSSGTLEKLTLDESSGLQTSGTIDKGNDANLDLVDATTGNPDADLFDGILSGFATSFNSFLNAATIFGAAGLKLNDSKKAYAASVEGAISATDFVKVTTTAGETVTNLFFSDNNGDALDGDQVVGMQTLNGDNVYLWSNGDFCIATTSATAGAGRVVAAFYLKDDAADHLTAQIQMATFEPLKHLDTASPDDSLNFTDVLRISASGTQTFNFNTAPSGAFLWLAVGTSASGILVTGGTPIIDAANKKTNDSDVIHTSQGGEGTTIGVNNQLFDNAGEKAVFSLVSGLQTLSGATGAGGDYTVDPKPNDNKAEGINYTGYNNVTGAGIFLSQSQGSPATPKDLDINVLRADADAGTAGTQPESGTGYIPGLVSDTAVNVATVTVKNALNQTVAVWSISPSGTEVASGATVGGVTVTITNNNIDVNGVFGAYTINWTSVAGQTFNRFSVVDEAGQFDIGKIFVDQPAAANTGVGSSLLVDDDGPTPGTDFVRHVDEDAMTGVAGTDLSTGNVDNPDDGDGIAGEQDEVSFTQADLSVLINSGTDKPPIFSLNTLLANGTAVATTAGANVFSKGVQVFWRVSGGALEGVTNAGTGSERVIFRITVNTQANADPSDDVFTFDLRDQLDHANAAGELANLLLNVTPAFRGTDGDLDPVNFGTAKIVLQVENDTPAPDGDTVTKHVDEDAMTGAGGGDLSTGAIDAAPDGDGIAGEQDEVTFSQADLQAVVATGADEPALFALNLALTNGTAVTTALGANVFSKGQQVVWKVSGGVVQGVTDLGLGSERVIFTLTVNQNGTPSDPSDDIFTYDLKDQLDHTAASGELGLLTLNVTPAFSATDRDGDPVDFTGSSAIRVEVENDTPAPDGDTVTKHADEDAMTGAGGGDLSTGNIEAPADADGIAGEQDEVTFSQADLQSVVATGADEPAYFGLNLSVSGAVKTVAGANVFSNGAQLFWSVSGTTIRGIVNEGMAGERIIFTITVNDGGTPLDPSDDIFTYDLKDQLDHGAASGELGLLTLNVTPAFAATDRDGDVVNLTGSSAIRVEVENDAPAPDGDFITKHVDEDAMTGAGGGDTSTGIIETPADSDGIAGEQDEVTFSQADLQGVVATGADELVSFALNLALSNGTAATTATGANIFSKGQQVFWKVSGGVVQGVTDLGLGSERVIFAVTVNQNGTPSDPSDDIFTFDLKDQLDHANGAGELGLLTLNVTPAFVATDRDGDPVNFGTAAPIRVEVENDAPTITAQIQDSTVQFVADATGTATKSLNGAVGADDTNASSQSQTPSVKQYIITGWTEPTNVFPNLDALLSADGTVLTYYSDAAHTDAVYQLSLNQTANSGAGSYTFTVLKAPPIVQNNFDFTDLPSGQNFMGVIATDKAALAKGGLLVFASNPDLNADGSMTNVSGTVNTSKGGGPVTIGNGNQAFDNTDEGAFFCYVDNPLATSVGGLGLTQTGADNANTIDFEGTNEATRASVEIVQASGAGTTKRPGPTLQITAYDIDPQTVGHLGDAGVETDSVAFALDPTLNADQSNIISVKIIDSTGKVIEYVKDVGAIDGVYDLQDSGDAGTDVTAADNSAVGITFNQDAAGIFSVVVSNLKANYTIEFETEAGHDLALVQHVDGSYDIGGFNVFNSVDIPAQDFDFSVRIADYDNDAFGGPLVNLANFGVTIGGVTF